MVLLLLLQFDISAATRVAVKGFIVKVMVQLSSFLCNPQSVGKPWLDGQFYEWIWHHFESCLSLLFSSGFVCGIPDVLKPCLQEPNSSVKKGSKMHTRKNTLMIAYVVFWPSAESVVRQEAFHFFLKQSQYICLWSLASVNRHVTHRSQ